MLRAASTGIAALLGLALAAGAAGADDKKRRQELVARFDAAQISEKLVGGGYTILLRHTSTTPRPGGDQALDLDDCESQRILSEAGRAEARRIGEAFRKLGIKVGDVLTSPYCRCVDTGKLAFGKGSTSEVLSVYDSLPLETKIEFGTEVRKLLDTPPAPGTNSVLITHTGNLLYAFGLEPNPEGVMHVFKPTGLSLGRASYQGKVTPAEWATLAGVGAE